MDCYHTSMANYKTTLPDHELFGDNCDDNWRDEFWVFAYGSLMWRPDFTYTERQPATVYGYHRSLCIFSWVHRGTREKPGLVFGLDVGGSCEGAAFKIPRHAQRETIDLLRARELVTEVYQEAKEPITLTGTRKGTVNAILYTAVLEHEQYASDLGHEETVRFIKQGVGKSGINTDYVLSTYDHLCEEGIRDDVLAALCRDIRG